MNVYQVEDHKPGEKPNPGKLIKRFMVTGTKVDDLRKKAIDGARAYADNRPPSCSFQPNGEILVRVRCKSKRRG